MSLLRRAKVLAARGMCNPLVGRALNVAFSQRIPTRGLRIDTRADGVMPETTASLFFGLYESAEIRFVRRHLRRDLDVLELGASIGVVTAHIAQHIARDRRVVAVEANPALLGLIGRNVRHNAHRPAEVVHGAVSYGGDPRVVFSVAERNVDSGIGRVGRPISVQAVTLSGLAERHGLSRIALVSDIEGAEAGMIFDDPAGLSHCEQLLIELHDTCYNGQQLSIRDLRHALECNHHFKLVDMHGAVHVFSR